MNLKFLVNVVIVIQIFGIVFSFGKRTIDENGEVHESNEIYFEVLKPLDISYSYRARASKIEGSSFEDALNNAHLVVTEPQDACDPIKNSEAIKGCIALVERGQCSFITKILNAESSGAIAVIVYDNVQNNELIIDMIDDKTFRKVKIPSAFIPWKDGIMMRKSILKQKSMAAIINIPLNMTYKNPQDLHRAPWSSW